MIFKLYNTSLFRAYFFDLLSNRPFHRPDFNLVRKRENKAKTPRDPMRERIDASNIYGGTRLNFYLLLLICTFKLFFLTNFIYQLF